MGPLSRIWSKGAPAWDAAASEEARRSGVTASIVLVTWNRLRMLQECVGSLLRATHGVEYELIVWDNASDDGTAAYLDEIASRHPRVHVVHSPENIGLNGVAAGVRLARGEYIVELDDDVIGFPDGWLTGMIHAFRAVPRAGYLAADVIQDETTNGAKPSASEYRARTYRDGVVIEHGPTGGWCTMTSRAVIEHIGNFAQCPGRTFFSEDGDFATRCRRHLYRVGIIRGLKIHHAAGIEANAEYGYLEQCRAKYAESDEYRTFLEHTVKAIERDEQARG